MRQNKGEWSELYAILYLLVNRKLQIVDSKLQIISNNIFEVVQIINEEKQGDIIFDFSDDGSYIIPNVFGIEQSPIKITEIHQIKNQLFSSIISSGGVGGAFSLENITNWLQQKGISTTFKAPANQKQDIILVNYDSLQGQVTPELGYSIKSQLGSPATILNASAQTNFRYAVKNLSQDDIIEINNINTREKLRDRITRIKDLGGVISFAGVESSIFDYNLQYIDTNFAFALAEALLSSYELGNKDLNYLFSISSIYPDKTMAEYKLKKFLSAVSLGMFPSIEWDGTYSANGGILLVSKDSTVYVLDNIYNEEEVQEYLLRGTKLDSPSTTRYHMLELKIEPISGEIFFTLNLQVRYKN